MRNIILSVVVVAALVVAGIGGTLADWTESDQGDYCFSAGYLNLRVDKGQMEDPTTGAISPIWFLQTTTGVDYLPLGAPDGVDDAYFADELGSIICQDDIEPGDFGEETISLHIQGDDTIAGANLVITGTVVETENGVYEPEITAGDRTFGANDGELADYLVMKLWWDDGDNVWEAGEDIMYEGSLTGLIDCVTNNPEELEFYLTKCTVYYIGISWKFMTYAEAVTAGLPSPNVAMDDCVAGDITLTVTAVHN